MALSHFQCVYKILAGDGQDTVENAELVLFFPFLKVLVVWDESIEKARNYRIFQQVSRRPICTDTAVCIICIMQPSFFYSPICELELGLNLDI